MNDLFYCDEHAKTIETEETKRDHHLLSELTKLVDEKIEICDDDMCSICTEKFTDPTDRTFISCGHPFHIVCIAKWILTGADTCPYCREKNIMGQQMPTYDDIMRPWLVLGATFSSTGLEKVIRDFVSAFKSDYFKCTTEAEKTEFESKNDQRMTDFVNIVRNRAQQLGLGL
jgi:hypothetical protein